MDAATADLSTLPGGAPRHAASRFALIEIFALLDIAVGSRERRRSFPLGRGQGL
jgi:hypothetical protein